MQRVSAMWIGLIGLVIHSSALACDGVVMSRSEIVRLDGHHPLPKHPEVYTGGFKVSFSLTSKAGRSDIRVDYLGLELRSFSPGSRPALSYEIGPRYAAGPAKPREFGIALHGEKVSRATWTKETAGVVARSENFLDTSDPNFAAFKLSSSESVPIKGTILAFKAGIYDVTLILRYRMSSGPGECVLASVRVYQDRD